MTIEPIPYQADIATLFAAFADQEGAVLFDSGRSDQQQARFDIFSAFPTETILIRDQQITYTNKECSQYKTIDFNALKTRLAKDWQRTSTSEEHHALPFCGGWIGFASYEYSYQREAHLNKLQRKTQLPLFSTGYYSWAVIRDHQEKKTFLFHEKDIDTSLLSTIKNLLQKNTNESMVKHSQITNNEKPFTLTEPFEQQQSFTDYEKAFNRIQQYLDQGDCYQVNLAIPYSAHYTGASFSAYRHLRDTVPSPFMAYMNLGEQQILSISPERFICANQSHIETRPIKGTSARNKDPLQDKIAADELRMSEKNRAENLMIVDLLRNDFGHHCIPGSIRVDELFTLESFNNVHHLVSKISGDIKPEYTIWDVFFSCFPGGSITGAPKIRACEIIAELEEHNREIYCGSIFYASNNGIFDSNIAIRTLLCNKGEITAWAGGGIVKDSTAAEEYEECQNKIRILLNALEQLT